MRILTTILFLVLTVFLCSCEQQQAAPDIDPRLGLECFESRRAALPPGTQYEGIEKLAGNVLTIQVMNGVALEMLDCELDPDGT